MSSFPGAVLRRHSPGAAHRLGWLAFIPLAIALLAVNIASADLPPVLRIGADLAARAGTAIGLTSHRVGGSTLVEVDAPATLGATGRLLAVSFDGEQAAIADRVGELSGLLILARADGSQLRVPFRGLLAAAFAPDGASVAVIDGRGALWQVDALSGAAQTLADGPFLGSPIIGEDGSVLLLSVASVEAPYRSQLVQLTPATGAAVPVSTDDLAYAGFRLADGSVAVVAHEPGRTLVRKVGPHDSQVLADLGPGAVNVAVASDGRRIAYEAAGRGIFLIVEPGSSPRDLGTGSHPCFGADGSALLIRRGAGTVAFALDGSVLANLDGAAAFAGAAGCLP